MQIAPPGGPFPPGGGSPRPHRPSPGAPTIGSEPNEQSTWRRNTPTKASNTPQTPLAQGVHPLPTAEFRPDRALQHRDTVGEARRRRSEASLTDATSNPSAYIQPNITCAADNQAPVFERHQSAHDGDHTCARIDTRRCRHEHARAHPCTPVFEPTSRLLHPGSARAPAESLRAHTTPPRAHPCAHPTSPCIDPTSPCSGPHKRCLRACFSTRTRCTNRVFISLNLNFIRNERFLVIEVGQSDAKLLQLAVVDDTADTPAATPKNKVLPGSEGLHRGPLPPPSRRRGPDPAGHGTNSDGDGPPEGSRHLHPLHRGRVDAYTTPPAPVIASHPPLRDPLNLVHTNGRVSPTPDVIADGLRHGRRTSSHPPHRSLDPPLSRSSILVQLNHGILTASSTALGPLRARPGPRRAHPHHCSGVSQAPWCSKAKV